MTYDLSEKKIAILATHGFEEIELTEPRSVLTKAGAATHIVSPQKGMIRSWDSDNWCGEFNVDVHLEVADASDYDGILLPGGVLNPDSLRTDSKAIEFLVHFLHEGKPIAAICHGPQLLIETGEIDGKTMTSYKSIKTDLINAGVNWVDKEVVVDQGLTTSRNPGDLPAFCKKMCEEYAEGVHSELAPN